MVVEILREKGKALSLNDVLLVPQHSSLYSRSEVDLFSERTGLRIPICSSPMDTVTGKEMQAAVHAAGGLGIHHRYTDLLTLTSILPLPIAVSPSMGWGWIDFSAAPTLAIDVAHGDSEPALEYAEILVMNGARVISGNIVTGQAARRYENIGVRWLRVGIGSGGSCTTRSVAGVGVPMLTAIQWVREAVPEAVIIADGGIRTSGDIVKALAAGADAVMLGTILASAQEAPGKRVGRYKQYRGMASEPALKENGKEVNIEGEVVWVELGPPVAEILASLVGGIRAGFAYLGAQDLSELHKWAQFVEIGAGTLKEGYQGTPHLPEGEE